MPGTEKLSWPMAEQVIKKQIKANSGFFMIYIEFEFMIYKVITDPTECQAHPPVVF
jgi:hypothetical protein